MFESAIGLRHFKSLARLAKSILGSIDSMRLASQQFERTSSYLMRDLLALFCALIFFFPSPCMWKSVLAMEEVINSVLYREL